MAGNVREYSELKKRAMLAKQRMRMGYWQSISEEKEKAISSSAPTYVAIKQISDIQRARFERDTNKNLGNIQAARDEAFYEKVCKILENNEDVTNPIGMLIEKDVFDKMDEANKQRYILELSKKFIQMRERYYKERIGKTC